MSEMGKISPPTVYFALFSGEIEERSLGETQENHHFHLRRRHGRRWRNIVGDSPIREETST